MCGEYAYECVESVCGECGECVLLQLEAASEVGRILYDRKGF